MLIHDWWLRDELRREKIHVQVFLPPDYTGQTHQSYPLLLFNDGQDMGAVKLSQRLHELYATPSFPPIIVAGIFAGDRMHEYGTANRPDYLGRGSKAHLYTHFVTQKLLPFLHKEYRIKETAATTAIAGFSLGGLSALDIAWHHPHLFGKVGVFSGSLWWRSRAFNKKDPDAHRIMHQIVAEGKKREGLKFWFQAGTKDETADRNNNGVIDAIDDTLDLMKVLEQRGYQQGLDMVYREVKGGIHHPSTWSKVLPEFLKWAFVSS